MLSRGCVIPKSSEICEQPRLSPVFRYGRYFDSDVVHLRFYGALDSAASRFNLPARDAFTADDMRSINNIPFK